MAVASPAMTDTATTAHDAARIAVHSPASPSSTPPPPSTTAARAFPFVTAVTKRERVYHSDVSDSDGSDDSSDERLSQHSSQPHALPARQQQQGGDSKRQRREAPHSASSTAPSLIRPLNRRPSTRAPLPSTTPAATQASRKRRRAELYTRPASTATPGADFHFVTTQPSSPVITATSPVDDASASSDDGQDEQAEYDDDEPASPSHSSMSASTSYSQEQSRSRAHSQPSRASMAPPGELASVSDILGACGLSIPEWPHEGNSYWSTLKAEDQRLCLRLFVERDNWKDVAEAKADSGDKYATRQKRATAAAERVGAKFSSAWMASLNVFWLQLPAAVQVQLIQRVAVFAPPNKAERKLIKQVDGAGEAAESGQRQPFAPHAHTQPRVHSPALSDSSHSQGRERRRPQLSLRSAHTDTAQQPASRHGQLGSARPQHVTSEPSPQRRPAAAATASSIRPTTATATATLSAIATNAADIADTAAELQSSYRALHHIADKPHVDSSSFESPSASQSSTVSPSPLTSTQQRTAAAVDHGSLRIQLEQQAERLRQLDCSSARVAELQRRMYEQLVAGQAEIAAKKKARSERLEFDIIQRRKLTARKVELEVRVAQLASALAEANMRNGAAELSALSSDSAGRSVSHVNIQLDSAPSAGGPIASYTASLLVPLSRSSVSTAAAAELLEP